MLFCLPDLINPLLLLVLTPPIFQGNGWKIVASFEGSFPNRIKQLPLDRHFDINDVKRVGSIIKSQFNFRAFLSCYILVGFFTFRLVLFSQIVLEADGYQPYLISPEKGLRSLIKGVLELAKEPSRLCVDEVHLCWCSIPILPCKGSFFMIVFPFVTYLWVNFLLFQTVGLLCFLHLFSKCFMSMFAQVSAVNLIGEGTRVWSIDVWGIYLAK